MSKMTLNPVSGENNEKSEWPLHPDDLFIPLFDTGVFIDEMASLEILPKKSTDQTQDNRQEHWWNPENLLEKAKVRAPDSLREGTYRGTQLALTKMYSLIEGRYQSYMDTVNFEPTVPTSMSLEEKRQFFAFTDGSDNFAPHLNLAGNRPAPSGDVLAQKAYLQPADIFNKMQLLQLSSLLPTLLPQNFVVREVAKIGEDIAECWLGKMGTPDAGTRLADLENYNRQRRAQLFHKDIFDIPNVGDLEDCYSDARFAQQYFTGTNPTTIERASDQWISHFADASKDTADAKAKYTIKALAPESLYMQDYSYFRKAAGIDESAIIKCEFDETYKDKYGKIQTRKCYRYGCASVCLFYLNDAGVLQPLAIVIDWRGSVQQSVTIYNRELIKRDAYLRSFGPKTDKEPEEVGEAQDWAWRYAKTCVQSSDWVRHELTVHLTHTHLVEESIIVAANRQLEVSHPVYRLLYPHWQKTLSLNAAARNTLVPDVIVKLVGFEDKDASKFIQQAYENFNFTEMYVPNDLNRRGFPLEKLNDRKFHNYAYARCISSMWRKIRNYVEEMLCLEYNGADVDSKVKNDEHLQQWSSEMRKTTKEGGANLKSFPSLTTFDELIDCVTMCIHIASPQHTAVNYPQNYYQSFVVNKPPCLYAPLPTSLEELLQYEEKDLVAALPMNHPQDWLLSSHVPYLLSFKPGNTESLIIYAASKYHVYKYKKLQIEQDTAVAAARFYQALAKSADEFKEYANDVDDSSTIKYDVLNPEWNAVSILI